MSECVSAKRGSVRRRCCAPCAGRGSVCENGIVLRNKGLGLGFRLCKIKMNKNNHKAIETKIK